MGLAPEEYGSAPWRIRSTPQEYRSTPCRIWVYPRRITVYPWRMWFYPCRIWVYLWKILGQLIKASAPKNSTIFYSIPKEILQLFELTPEEFHWSSSEGRRGTDTVFNAIVACEQASLQANANKWVFCISWSCDQLFENTKTVVSRNWKERFKIR